MAGDAMTAAQRLAKAESDRARLVAALRVFVDKYQRAPDGPLGVGLTNGDFFRAAELLQEIAPEE